MEIKTSISALSILLVAAVFVLALDTQPVEGESTRLYVYPTYVFAFPSETFNVDIRIEDVQGLYAWQVNMSFDPTLLEFINVTEGDFLKDQPEGTQSFSRINNTQGWVLFGWTTLGKYQGVSGSGTLATVEFFVEGFGEAVLNITHPQTYLLKWNPPPVPPGGTEFEDIPAAMENGYFNNDAPIFMIEVSPASLAIEKGEFAASTVTVTSYNGFSNPITLAVSNIPPGVTVNLDPVQVTPPPDDSSSSTLTLQVNLMAMRGNYTLILSGTNGTLQRSVEIALEITGPVSCFSYSPNDPKVYETVTFNGSKSYDVDGTIAEYEWDFGDGDTDTGIIVTHSYDQADTFTVTLIVTDDEGVTDTSTQLITIAKLSSAISVFVSPESSYVMQEVTLFGAITPSRPEATVAIWYRLLGNAWSELSETSTNQDSEYSYTWTPLDSGTYEFQISWTGDANTLPAESSTVTVDVVPFPELSIKLSGDFDYSSKEKVKIKLAALVKDIDTREAISDANVKIDIFYQNGTLWISENMTEKLAGSGIYEWESNETIEDMWLEDGIFLVHVKASVGDGPVATDMMLFHIDPPSDSSTYSLTPLIYYVTVSVIIASGTILGVALLRRHRRLEIAPK